MRLNGIFPMRSRLASRKGPARLLAVLGAGAIAIATATAGPAAPASPSAASGESDSAVSGEARAALRKAVAFHREARDLSLKFSASVYNAALDKRDEYEGRLLLKGGDKFRLEIPGGVYVSDGKSYWEYHARTKQAILKEAGTDGGQPMPADVLLRFLDSEPLAASRARDGGREWIELRLDPARAMKNLDSLDVLLDESTFAVHRVSSRDESGNEAVYTVQSIRRNSGLKDSEFRFQPPKGVETVDMRGG